MSRRLVETIAIVAVALGLALGIQAFIVKPFRIPSESMVPTLEIGQRVLVDRVTQKFGAEYHRGDVLVFTPPAGADTNSCAVPERPEQGCPESTEEKSDQNFIKRVVGLEGDRISIRGGHVFLNGRRQSEPFVNTEACAPNSACNLPREITVPEGQLYMLGDNRGASADSRVWGPISEDWVIGQAFATYWPPKKIGTL